MARIAQLTRKLASVSSPSPPLFRRPAASTTLRRALVDPAWFRSLALDKSDGPLPLRFPCLFTLSPPPPPPSLPPSYPPSLGIRLAETIRFDDRLPSTRARTSENLHHAAFATSSDFNLTVEIGQRFRAGPHPRSIINCAILMSCPIVPAKPTPLVQTSLPSPARWKTSRPSSIARVTRTPIGHRQAGHLDVEFVLVRPQPGQGAISSLAPACSERQLALLLGIFPAFKSNARAEQPVRKRAGVASCEDIRIAAA